jgi:hypothetical protein
MPLFPMVAEVLVLSPPLEEEVAGEPKYISDFFLTPGVARVVGLANFWHLEQTILTDKYVEYSLRRRAQALVIAELVAQRRPDGALKMYMVRSQRLARAALVQVIEGSSDSGSGSGSGYRWCVDEQMSVKRVPSGT